MLIREVSLETDILRFCHPSHLVFYRKFPDFSDYNWNLILKDDNEVGMVVFLQPDNLFVGTCSFQGVQKENLELGYDIAKELRGKGIGTRTVGALF